MLNRYEIFHVEWRDGSGTARVFRSLLNQEQASIDSQIYEQMRRVNDVKLGKVVRRF
jgi:hypothetical protein